MRFFVTWLVTLSALAAITYPLVACATDDHCTSFSNGGRTCIYR